MIAPAHGQPRLPELHIVVQQRHPDGTAEVFMDEHGEAFIAIVGTHHTPWAHPR